MSYAIITDTSANLPTPMLKAAGIHLIPFHYIVNGEVLTCTDTETFDGAAYFGAMRKGQTVTTSQINPQAYIDCFEPLLRDGQDILFVGMSSAVSGAYQSAQIAVSQLRDEFPEREIRLIDSLGAAQGEGLLALKAAKLRDEGMELADVARELLSMRKRMAQIFMVDDLMYLKRTGRLSGAAAVVGTMLHIKPLLKGNEKGQIVTYAKARDRRKGIEALAAHYDELVVDAGSQMVCITHADCEKDAQYLAELLNRNHPPKEILTVMYDPVTGSHVGPDTLALFFLSDDDVRLK